MKVSKRAMQVFFIVLFLKLNIYGQQNSKYELVYEADKNGEVISGSLEKLNEYVGKGYILRVGWNMGNIQHWAEAMFITQFEGHVFAQIHSIFMQAPFPSKFKGKTEVVMPNKDPNGWTAIIGTTGALEMKWNGFNFKWDKEKHKTEKEFKDFVKSFEKGSANTKWVVVK